MRSGCAAKTRRNLSGALGLRGRPLAEGERFGGQKGLERGGGRCYGLRGEELRRRDHRPTRDGGRTGDAGSGGVA